MYNNGGMIMKKSKSEDNKISYRQLYLYNKLTSGDIIKVAEEAKHLNAATRTIHRDIGNLRTFFADMVRNGESQSELIYDRKLKGYRLVSEENSSLSNSEVLAVCKILLESRAFRKDDITPIIEKLLTNCVPKQNQRMVSSLISNELHHYIEPRHKKHFVESLWDLGNAVNEHRPILVTYEKVNGSVVERRVLPVGIMFSEYYFYLTAFIDGIDKAKEFDNKDDIFPTIYRIDRIRSFEILDEHFDIPYKDRFEEGEFRKRIQFMTGGTLRRINFLFKGINPEAILDRFPTAEIRKKTDEGFIITAEVFGDGVDMWLKSQGDFVTIL